MAAIWQVVLTADGAVLGVAGGAPRAWVGLRLDECDDVSPAIHQAARTLLDALHGSVAPMATATVEGPSGETIQLTAIEAVPLRRAALDLRPLLESVVSLMRVQASALDVELALQMEPDLPASVSLDPDKLAWAVTTLIGNALRYVRRGSRLMPGGLVSIGVTHDAAAGEITISVHDDGLGIPADKLPFIFRRAPDHPFAAGLGLRMVLDVVAAHGGRVDIASLTDPVQHGTTIRLTFPVL